MLPKTRKVGKVGGDSVRAAAATSGNAAVYDIDFFLNTPIAVGIEAGTGCVPDVVAIDGISRSDV
jgi:hypothetical protein